MTILHKLNLILLSNNDHETSGLSYQLSKNDWEVNHAFNAKECHDFMRVINTDAIVINMDNEDIVNYDLIDWLSPNYPVIVIDQLHSDSVLRKLNTLGCIMIDAANKDDLLVKTVTDAVSYYRFEKAAA